MTDKSLVSMLAQDATEVLTEWFRRTGTAEDPTSAETRVVWLTADTFCLEDQWGTQVPGTAERYHVTVIVEPMTLWREVTWYDVALCTPEGLPPTAQDTRPLVRLGGVEAVVLSAVAQRWHVRPGTGDASWNPPVAEENDTVAVRLQMPGQEPRFYNMPPSGKVEMLTEPIAPAVANIVNAFPTTTEVQP